MSNCNNYHELMEALLAGEISNGEMVELTSHCQTCPECQALLELHETMQAEGELMHEPTASELKSIRDEVLVATMHKQPSRFGQGFFADLLSFSSAYPAAAAVVVFFVISGAVFAGRWSAPNSQLPEEALLQMVALQSSQSVSDQELKQASLDEFWDNPFTFANVTVREKGAGQLALGFDISRHVDLVTAGDSRLAQEVLLNAILEPSSTGSRFKAMEVTANLPNARLRQALVLTMHNDPSLTVRLQAMAALKAGPYDQKVEEALLVTLQQDQEVQMRLEALDVLTKQQVGTDLIRQTVYESGLDSDGALLQRVSQMTGEF